MSVEREARHDAKEFARAAMFYGDGAGIRRKLIAAQVQSKADHDAAYGRAFQKAMDAQDLGKHATAARRERERIDAGSAIAKNARGLVTGNYASVNTGVLVIVGGLLIAHKTGFDKKVIDATKTKYQKAKHWYEAKKAFRDIKVVDPDRSNYS